MESYSEAVTPRSGFAVVPVLLSWSNYSRVGAVALLVQQPCDMMFIDSDIIILDLLLVSSFVPGFPFQVKTCTGELVSHFPSVG
jgi:hypothetical protein